MFACIKKLEMASILLFLILNLYWFLELLMLNNFNIKLSLVQFDCEYFIFFSFVIILIKYIKSQIFFKFLNEFGIIFGRLLNRIFNFH
ncbi:hypothetical protein AXG55_13070 [Silvanigrella aquatica]|uniref:Uncharacterized protein n=1 Tax=Silvanigrella aquatica TaxID=1915309 RepID=A0A1L4D3M5_9BACT|nr:hypothetical protein AXG55_13070 [Silvanigrella aquatica]